MMEQKNLDFIKGELDKELGVKTKIITVTKNGVNLKGLCLKDHCGISPIIYYTGEPADVFIRQAKEIFNNARLAADTDVLKDRNYILDNVRISVQRRTESSGLKKQFLNVEAILRLDLIPAMESENTYSTVLSSDLLALSGVTPEEAWAAAEKNTFESLEITSLEEIIGLGDDMPHMFDIITSKSRMHGAAALFFPAVFKAYCEKHKLQGCILLPSSIHELLILDPAVTPGSYSDMKAMVQQVNNTEVIDNIEQLEPAVYLYELDTDEIRIVA